MTCPSSSYLIINTLTREINYSWVFYCLIFSFMVYVSYICCMKKHTKIYMDAFGYDVCDFIPCEISGVKANDIHHIDCRGMGGDPKGKKDRIEELQAISRDLHVKYGDKKEHMSFLYRKHYDFLENNGVKFDKKYLIDKIKRYEVH